MISDGIQVSFPDNFLSRGSVHRAQSILIHQTEGNFDIILLISGQKDMQCKPAQEFNTLEGNRFFDGPVAVI